MSQETPTFPNNHIQIGGRKSRLAVVQSEIVKEIILKKYPHLECSILALSTLGDKVQGKPLYSFGGKALWTSELETLLVSAVGDYPQLDLIVHSLKDMPTNLPEDFELGCILDREDPRDVLVVKKGLEYKCLEDLPDGSVVGTSSVRRSSQLMKSFPKLRFESVRGNVNTRLSKLDDPSSPYSCLLLAYAGLGRVGLGDRATCFLNAPQMYHAVGQGALGIEIRKNDEKMRKLLQLIEDIPATYCCLAERSLMRHLEGGCSVPIGVQSSFDPHSKTLALKGTIVSPDGLQFVEDSFSAIVDSKSDADEVGIRLADLLVAKGGKKILDEINFEKINQPPSVPTVPADTTPAVPETQ